MRTFSGNVSAASGFLYDGIGRLGDLVLVLAVLDFLPFFFDDEGAEPPPAAAAASVDAFTFFLPFAAAPGCCFPSSLQDFPDLSSTSCLMSLFSILVVLLLLVAPIVVVDCELLSCSFVFVCSDRENEVVVAVAVVGIDIIYQPAMNYQR